MKLSVAAWLTGVVASIVGALGYLSIVEPYAFENPSVTWEDPFFQFWCAAPYLFWLVIGFNFRKRKVESLILLIGSVLSAAIGILVARHSVERASTEGHQFLVADVVLTLMSVGLAQWSMFLIALCVVTVLTWRDARIAAFGAKQLLFEAEEDTNMHPILPSVEEGPNRAD